MSEHDAPRSTLRATELADEIHDTVAQSLAALGLRLDMARSLVETSAQQAIEELDECIRLCHSATADIRRTIGRLRNADSETESIDELHVVLPYSAPEGAIPGPIARTAGPVPQAGMVELVIADDHPLARTGVRHMLESPGWIRVVGEADDGLEAVGLAQRLRPAVVLMDVRMPGLDGILATAKIAEASPRTRVILMSAEGKDEQVLQGLKAGARGYVLKDSDSTIFFDAIRNVAEGRTFLAPSIASRMAESLSSLLGPALSPRECELLELIAAGFRNKDIALQLSVSEGTVKWHVVNILQKLNVPSRTAAVNAARARGIIQ